MNKKEVVLKMDELIRNIQCNNVEACNRLLAKGADPNGHEDIALIRPVHFAAAYNAGNTMLALLAAGANPHHQTIDGQTAMNIAKLHNHDEIVQMLERYILPKAEVC